MDFTLIYSKRQAVESVSADSLHSLTLKYRKSIVTPFGIRPKVASPNREEGWKEGMADSLASGLMPPHAHINGQPRALSQPHASSSLPLLDPQNPHRVLPKHPESTSMLHEVELLVLLVDIDDIWYHGQDLYSMLLYCTHRIQVWRHRFDFVVG
ncbi:hypothetical protein PAHAL_4G153400 [Panicum hallii]|jgi:hypothetical protein|uniref:Uncharacterized protein n=1 Tax=Panicum hallii TaxID=206008 RepID=A0A2T8JCZ0_9POAL|nr:hypothetical protein PAHAL_4G153400 [Panicum hallii]